MKALIANLQKYYGIYLLIIAVFFLILWFPNRSVNRYAISGNVRENGAVILDTRTGQAWLRLTRSMHDLGTIDKPKYGKRIRILREETWMLREGRSGKSKTLDELLEETGGAPILFEPPKEGANKVFDPIAEGAVPVIDSNFSQVEAEDRAEKIEGPTDSK